MRRGYKRRRRRGLRRVLALGLVPLSVLSLSLLWIWKSNQVKEYHAIMRRLEAEIMDLNAENSRLGAGLADLKSLSWINKIVTEQFGLTQNVSQRISLPDPVTVQKVESRSGFAVQRDIPDWLEEAVTGSGKIRAEPPKPPARKKK